jgi:tetratricopeptide (TPR) repeat protein
VQLNKKTVLIGFGAVALGTLVFGIVVLFGGHREPVDPRLTGEQMALAQIRDVHYLFYTPASHADLAAARPDLISQGNEHEFARAAQDPATFRIMDHERQFDALLLAGDTTTYQPLIHDLAEAKDFVLVWLDNSTLVFRRRGARAWSESDLYSTANQFQGQNRARFLAGAATRLIGLRQLDMAKRALDQAQPLGGNVPEYWTAQALYDGEVAHWTDAIAALDHALRIDSDFTPALTTKAEILYGARRYDEALAISDKVVAEHPDDPTMLFFHATISHQAHAYDREIAALKHLIELADAQGDSTTGYRIYLGQAYAETGDAPNSLTQFKMALVSPDISPEQRKFVNDCIARIGVRTGMQ